MNDALPVLQVACELLLFLPTTTFTAAMDVTSPPAFVHVIITYLIIYPLPDTAVNVGVARLPTAESCCRFFVVMQTKTTSVPSILRHAVHDCDIWAIVWKCTGKAKQCENGSN